jgi:hypothetical protein
VTASLAATVRARPGTIALSGGPGAITFKVEEPERWDVVRLTASPSETVMAVKIAALAAMEPGADHRRWMMKLRGAEIVAESQTLADVDARTGSTFLLTHRRRRPVR